MTQAAGGWAMPVAAGPPEFLPVLDVAPPDRQRRLTVFFRYLLLLPQFIVVWVLSVVAFLAAVVTWFAALVTARVPAGIARYQANYLAYETRVMSSMTLLVDRYPPFSLRQPRDYPVQVEVRPGRLNRLAVFFRLILMIPAGIVASLLMTGWFVPAFFIWLWVVITARLPQPLFEATAALVRFRMRFIAYALMITSAYPKRLFGDQPTAEPAQSATRPLVLGTAGKVFLVAFLVFGLGVEIGTPTGGNSDNNSSDTNTTINTAPDYGS